MCTDRSPLQLLAPSLIGLAVAITTSDTALASQQRPTTSDRASFHTMALGNFTIVALSDGSFDLPAEELLIEDKSGVVKALLGQAHLPSVLPSTVNAYLIDTGKQRILVDTGAGDLQGSGLGKLQAQASAI
jgi:hypothetical protein